MDELSKQILSDLLSDFANRNLSADALTKGYVGVSLNELNQKYFIEKSVNPVDFDLALKDLEKDELAKTGPMVLYENPPGSLSMFIGFFYSKREYLYLTEKGYKAVRRTKSTMQSKPAISHVQISGSNFYQSQIGIGDQVAQSMSASASNDTEAIDRLIQLLSETGVPINEAIKQEIALMVTLSNQGNIPEAKSIFQKLFGVAADGVKQAAWGVLTAVIAKQMGL